MPLMARSSSHRPPGAWPSRSTRSCANAAASGSRTAPVPPTARWSMPATRSACRPTAPPTICAGSGSKSRRSRPTMAASRTKGCGRSVTWWTCGPGSARTTGMPIRTSTPASPPRCTTNSARATRPSSSRTITWRWSRRNCDGSGPMYGRPSSGTSRGRTRIGCASVRGVANCSRACSPTISSPSRSSAIGGTSCWRWKKTSAPRWKRRRRGSTSAAATAPSCRCRSGSTTTASSGWRRTRRCRPKPRASRNCSRSRRRSSASAWIGSTTRKVSRSGWPRSTCS